jgi:hypothetical protein
VKKALLLWSLMLLSPLGLAWSQEKQSEGKPTESTELEGKVLAQVKDKQAALFSKQNFPALATVAIGLVGTLVSLSAAWAKDLNATAQRIRVLEDAMKRAQFWDTWSKALATVDPEANTADLKAQLKAEILASAEPVQQLFHKTPANTPSLAGLADYLSFRSSLSRFRRWLLLYKPPRGRAWVPRIFFYYYLMTIPLRPFLSSHSMVFSVIYSLVMALFFRWLSAWAEKPHVVRQH